jgi:hypothetical protein
MYTLHNNRCTNHNNCKSSSIGEIEGNLGAIRLFGVLKQYQGICFSD